MGLNSNNTFTAVCDENLHNMQGQCPAHDTPWKIRLTVTECFDVTYMNWASLCGSAGKESTCKVGNQDSIPGLGRSPGEGKGCPLQYSGLENSMDCILHGVTKSWTRLSDFHFHTWWLASKEENTERKNSNFTVEKLGKCNLSQVDQS